MSWQSALRERVGTPAPPLVEGGASFAYTAGSILTFLLAFEVLTGVALAAFYSPSTSSAWASVAYLQDQATLGWLVRGIHHHGGGAIVVVAGIHLVQTALAGAYKRPRELVWWLGVALLVLVLAWAITGYVLPWDQRGYWANQVEIGIAAATPIVGASVRSLALGGNDYGNLTLTRFYALHVALLPAVVVVITVVHVRLARRHGNTPMHAGPATPRWPAQSLRDAIGIAIVVAILLAVAVSTHGVPLAAPADPSVAFDARPLWYFRWLYELRELTGSYEKLAALAAPAVVGGYLVALPLLDRSAERAPRARIIWLAGLAGLLALIAALTMMSFARDRGSPELAQRNVVADRQATKARHLAHVNGVPVTGALDVYATVPMYRARTLWEQSCKGCHEEHVADSKPRKGPLIGPGFGNRKWLAAFLLAPSGPDFWGHTKLALDPELAMKAVELPAADQHDLVEVLYAQSEAADVDPAARDRGAKTFETTCTDCHSLAEGDTGTNAPGLGALHDREYFISYISNPHAVIHMGAHSEMPRFDKDLSIADRDALAAYLVWLRTATAADLTALGPL